MKILGLLQNQWAYNPARVREMLDRATPKNRHKLIRYMLVGSRTGRHLNAALGPAFDAITWDNVTPVVTRSPSGQPPADLDYVRQLLAEVRSTLVVTFGQVARRAMLDVDWPGRMFAGPHPAARGPMVSADLVDLGTRIAAWIRKFERAKGEI